MVYCLGEPKTSAGRMISYIGVNKGSFYWLMKKQYCITKALLESENIRALLKKFIWSKLRAL